MKKARNIFLAVFIFSMLATCASLFFLIVQTPASAPAEEAPSQPVATLEPNSGNEEQNASTPLSGQTSSGLALLSSVFTAITSLVGFITTTVITWRKEKRDAELAVIERQKLELELEKNRLELEELKKKNK